MFELQCPDPKPRFGKSEGSHKMVWLEWGDKGGKPIVCVHGLARNAHDFDYLAVRLVEKGYRVICPDVVGRGKSDWLKNPKYYGYPLYCADVLHLLEHLQLKQVDWLGTSMGGLMGIMVAASDPQRISRLILNDVGSFIPKESLQRIGGYIAARVTFNNIEEGKEYLRVSMQSFGVYKEEHLDYLARHAFIRKVGGKLHIAYDPAIALAFKSKSGKMHRLPDMDFSALWNKVTCPVLVLRGAESDLLLRHTAEEMAKRDTVDFIEFTGCGHAPMLMEQEQIQAVMNWLG